MITYAITTVIALNRSIPAQYMMSLEVAIMEARRQHIYVTRRYPNERLLHTVVMEHIDDGTIDVLKWLVHADGSELRFNVDGDILRIEDDDQETEIDMPALVRRLMEDDY